MITELTIDRWEHALSSRTRQGSGEGLASILALAGAHGIISFAGGFPDPSLFPGPVLAELLRSMLASGDSSALQYAPVDGLPGIRAYISERLERLDGCRPTDAGLLVTSGAVEALELAGKALLDAGDTVTVEAPTYLGAIMAFRSFEASVIGVAMDEDGLDVDALGASWRRGPLPKLLYTVPDYQNPTGVTMSLDKRHALIELARRFGVLIVEDVAYRELGFAGDRLPSLWSLGPDTVLQAGTFSKTFAPGVRLGWAAGPEPLIKWMRWAKQTSDQCAGALGQRLVEAYGRAGLMDSQSERSRELYGRRCRLMLEALAGEMPPGTSWTRPRGGFFTWLTLPDGADSVGLAVRAQQTGLAFVPGVPFFPDGRGARNVRLSFSFVQDALIRDGIARLGRLVRSSASP